MEHKHQYFKMEDHQENESSTTTSSSRSAHNMYLVICNISKRPNVQALFSTAAAFGCKGVFVVGQKSFDTNPTGPDVPTPIRNYILEGEMTIQRFANWGEFLEFIKGENIRLLGVEIHKDAKSIDEYFDNSKNETVKTAFLMGNEGQGLSKKQLESCDGFVRIPQYGNGTASLNVYVACSIVLQRYHQWTLGL